MRPPREMVFLVGGEEFVLPKPFLSIHSPCWKRRFADDPWLEGAELHGSAESFRSFLGFIRGAEGCEVQAGNVLHLLHWAKEMDVDYVAALCEDVLLCQPPKELDHSELLELAARHNMPLLYSKATELVAQDMTFVDVPEIGERGGVPPAMASKEIREDLLRTHISMGLMRGDGEIRRRHRFADHTALNGASQRARLHWKNRSRFENPPEKPPAHDWRAVQTVWPHHSLRSDDWTVVPAETQPTMPLRNRGACAIRQMMS